MVTDILHLHGQKMTAYKGNYDTFERTREERVKNQVKSFEANERARSHMQVFLASLHPKSIESNFLLISIIRLVSRIILTLYLTCKCFSMIM